MVSTELLGSLPAENLISKAKEKKNPVVLTLVSSTETIIEEMREARKEMISEIKSIGTSIETALKSVHENKIPTTVNLEANSNSVTLFSSLLSLVGKEGKLNYIPILLERIFRVSQMTVGTGFTQLAEGMERLRDSGRSLMMLSGGIATLGLAIWGFSEVVTAGGVLAVAGTLFIFSQLTAIEKKAGKGLLFLSAGIASLGLAIWGFTEVVDLGMLLEISGSLLMIFGVIAIGEKITRNGNLVGLGIGLSAVGLGVAALGLGLKLWEDIDVSNVLTAGLALSAIGIASKLVKGREMVMAAVGIAAISGGIALLGLALESFDVDVSKILTAGVAIGGLSVALFLVGKFARPIVIGALTLAAASISLMILAQGLQAISDVDIDLRKGGELLLLTGVVAGVFAIVGIPAFSILVATGSVAIGLMSGSLWLLAKSMETVSKSEIDVNRIESFGNGVEILGERLSRISGWNLIAAPIVGGLIAASVIPMALALAAVSVTKIPDIERISRFTKSVEILVNGIGGLNAGNVLKLGLVSPVLILAGTSMVLVAAGITAFAYLTTKPERVEKAVESVKVFVNGISDVFGGSLKRSKEIRVGIRSFLGVGNLMTSMASGIAAIGKLRFEEYDDNGKLIRSRSFTQADFANVGNGIGQILMAISGPLSEIGSAKEEWNIGGLKITNPFGNKVKSGVKALSGIGSILKPITGIFEATKDVSIEEIKVWKTTFALLLKSVGDVFMNLQARKDLGNGTLGLLFFNAEKMFKTIATGKFEPMAVAFERVGRSMQVIREAINSLDMERLAKLDATMYHVTQAGSSDNLDRLERIIEAMNKNSGENTVEKSFTRERSEKTTEKSTVKKADDKNLIEAFESGNDEVSALLNRMLNLLNSGTIVVKTKPVGEF